MSRHNELGQPIDFAVPGWAARPRPPRTAMEGRYAVVEPIDPDRHVAELFAANSEDKDGRMWTYMAYGPFATLAEYRAWIEAACLGDDPLFHAIRDRRTGRTGGVASYLRIDPPVGVIEIGHIALSPSYQDTVATTEAMYLMMARVFDELGYRRYEWKCDALNEPSRRAAERLGFTFEGIFRQATLYKGRNRDTAWYAVIDKEWPALKRAYPTWLDPENFANGRQRQSLRSLTAAALGR
jgi:RimJ/RimL family protein N-acetyltransferase